MRLLFICITLTALMQQLEAQGNVHEVGFQGQENQNIAFSKRETKLNESGESWEDPITTNKPENETEIQGFPPIRCLGCDHYCDSFEDGKDASGLGNRMCNIELGVLHGCVSIYMYGLKRKCVVDMSTEEKLYCKENVNLCIKCSSPDCNYVNLTINGVQTSGSAAFMTSLLLLLGTCLISCLVMSG